MAKDGKTDYTELDRPYDNFLQRSEQDIVNVSKASQPTPTTSVGSSAGGDVSGGIGISGDTNQSNGNVERQPVKSDGAMGDVWIKNFIRSENWKPKSIGFYIDGKTGYAEFTNVFISGEIQALTGEIGGWTINSTSLSSSGIIIDSTGSISSVPFVSGPLGTGWSINGDGTAEFQNVTVRGTIRTSVFEKDTISAVNGMVLVSKADVLDTDMTALDSSTLTITGESSFVANEVIRIKDGTDDEWMLVTSVASAPTYVVTRDLAGSYSSNNNPVWTKGTAVVSMGVGSGTKTGFILLDSSSANSPYIDIYGRNSTTYTDYTLHGRYGWLKGITDSNVGLSGTDVWGLYSDSVYLTGTINATSGKFGTSTNYWSVGATGLTAVSPSTDVFLNYGKTDFGQDSTNGFILGYDFSATKPKFEIGSSATKLMTYDGTDFTLLGGIITGGTIRTAASGARIELLSSTTRLNAINSTGTVLVINNGDTAGVGILTITPNGTASRCIEIIIPSGLGSSAKAITIDNPSASICIDMTDAGSTGINMAGASTNGIKINHSGTNAALDISGNPSGEAQVVLSTSGDYPSIDMTYSGTSSNSYGIRITATSAAVKDSLYIANSATSHVLRCIYINRAASADNQVVAAMRIDATNSGVGGKACGIDFTGATIQSIMNVATDNTDPTGGGGAATGRIPIYVAGVLKYLAYY